MQAGVELAERDIFDEPLSAEEIGGLAAGQSISTLFSWKSPSLWKSPSFRRLGLAREDLTDRDMLHLMFSEPRLIRRPLIRVGDELIVGFDEERLHKALRPEK